jgi:hypothetical protein
LCNSRKGKTSREPEILYSLPHKGLRDFRASPARRIPARFVQHGARVEGQSAPGGPPDLQIMNCDYDVCETKPNLGAPGHLGGWRVREAYRAKQSQFARLRRVGGATGAWDVGANAQNEPNSSIADSERPAARRLVPVRAGCTNNPNSTRSRRGSLYKQTQFPRPGSIQGNSEDGRTDEE